MKTNRLVFMLFLLLIAAVFHLAAQQTKTGQKPIEEVKAKAEAGDASSQLELGLRYHNGEGVAKDPVEAVKWFRKAAEQNIARAQYDLGICYANGEGVAKDPVEAVKWYRKAAEQNYARAHSNLGICYYKGEGVAKDLAEAVKWFRKAAEQNLADAQLRLGFLYYKGEGVAKDPVEAVKWFRKAAEQNFADAQLRLGNCYQAGMGVAKDQVEAAKWYRKAAEQNLAEAQSNLGFCYMMGEGVAKDYVEAYKWELLAAGQGEEKAKKTMTVLESQMTPEQIAEAQKLARNFKPAAGQGDELEMKTMTVLESQMTPEQIAEAQKLARNFKPAAEVIFGGRDFPPLHNYSLQLPASWTVQPQEDKSLGAHGPPGVSLSAFVISTVLSPEENMEKIITGSLQKKEPGYKVLEKGSLKNNASQQAHFVRYQRDATSGFVWVDYYFQLADKEVVILVFSFPSGDSKSVKSVIEAIFNSVKVAASSSPQSRG